MMLNMPGMQNVPIGDLEIGDNKVPCNCSMIKVKSQIFAVLEENILLQELATLTDFDYLTPKADLDYTWEDLMFQKLFYSTAVCIDQSGLQFRLRRFARKALVVETEEETGDKHVVCRWVISLSNSAATFCLHYF